MIYQTLCLRIAFAAIMLMTAGKVAQARLYVADHGGFGKVGIYDLPSGDAINPWVVDAPAPFGIAVSATDLYVGSNNNGTVGKLNLSTNAWNSSFINAPFEVDPVGWTVGDWFLVSRF